MNNVVSDFLKTHRVSVFSLMRDEHSIDSATLHFAHSKEPLAFYFMTDKTSRKVKALQPGKASTAALVIGFDEAEFATFQAEGEVLLLEGTAAQEGFDIYIQKLPEREKLRNDPDIAVLKFTPTWWRLTDMKSKPKTVISSE